MHHLALVARIGGSVFDVVGDRLDQLADVGAQDPQLLHHAFVRNEGALAQRHAAVDQHLHGTHALQFVEHRARRHVAAMAAHQLGKPVVAVHGQGLRRAVRPGEARLAHPRGEHAGGTVVVRGEDIRPRRRLGQQQVDVLARQAGEDGRARDRRLLARQREVLHRRLDVDALGDRLEGAIGKRVLQQQAHERAKELRERQAHCRNKHRVFNHLGNISQMKFVQMS